MRPGREADHTPPSSAEVKELNYTSTHPMGPPGPVTGFPFSQCCGSQGSVVGKATCYGLEGPGIESRWGEIFRTCPDRLRDPPRLLYDGYRVFPGGKGGRGVMLTTHPILVLRLRKSWAIPPLTLWVLLGLLRGSLLVKAALFRGYPADLIFNKIGNVCRSLTLLAPHHWI
jgi:hypothetical protein